MQLFLESLDREVAELDANGVRIRFIGDRARLAPALVERMDCGGGAHRARIAASTSRSRSPTAAAGTSPRPREGSRATSPRAGATPRGHRRGDARAPASRPPGAPAPDLFIRTGGERRISNFLLWDLAYTELWFTDTLWPDFDAACFAAALADFGGRERRFGRVAGPAGAD